MAREIVLGARTLASLHKQIGDTLTVGYSGVRRTMRIVGEAVFPAFGIGTFTPTSLGDGAELTGQPLAAGTAGEGCPRGASCYNFFLMRFPPAADINAANRELTKFAGSNRLPARRLRARGRPTTSRHRKLRAGARYAARPRGAAWLPLPSYACPRARDIGVQGPSGSGGIESARPNEKTGRSYLGLAGNSANSGGAGDRDTVGGYCRESCMGSVRHVPWRPY